MGWEDRRTERRRGIEKEEYEKGGTERRIERKMVGSKDRGTQIPKDRITGGQKREGCDDGGMGNRWDKKTEGRQYGGTIRRLDGKTEG